MTAYAPGELESLVAEISSLSQQLTNLSRQSAQRIFAVQPPGEFPLGQHYRVPGDYRQFLQLRRQHADHPQDLAALTALADLLHRNDKLAESEGYLLKALALEPLSQAMLFQLGELYIEKGEFTNAWGSFQEIIYLNPENLMALLAQGQVREAEGNFAGAMVIYDKVEEQVGPSARIYYRRAMNLAGRGDFGDAVTLAREGLNRYPDHAPLYYARARAYAGLGLLDRAKTDLYDALALDSELLVAFEALGDVSLLEGNAVTAMRAFLQVLGKRPGSAEASFKLGRAYLLDLRFDEAAREWELLDRLHPNDRNLAPWLSQAYFLQALEHKRRGRFREALQAQRRARSRAGGNQPEWVVQALVSAGGAALAHNEYQRSLDYYDRAIRNNPFRADTFVALSRTYRAMQDSRAERNALQQALALDPQHPDARRELLRANQP